jgi:hypothetical protein
MAHPAESCAVWNQTSSFRLFRFLHACLIRPIPLIRGSYRGFVPFEFNSP